MPSSPSRRAAGPGTRGRWLAVAGAAPALAASVYVVAAGTAAGRSADKAVLDQDLGGPAEGIASAVVHALGPVTTVFATCVFLAFPLWRRDLSGVAAVIAVVAGSIALSLGAEEALEALDPLGVEGKRDLGPGFYPSGHAATILALALGPALVAPPGAANRLVLVTSVWAGAMGGAIVGTESHTPSDVVGGFLVAVFMTALAGAALDRSAAGRPRLELRTTSALRRLAALALRGALAAAAIEAARLGGAPLEVLHPLLVASALALAALAFWIVAAAAAAATGPPARAPGAPRDRAAPPTRRRACSPAAEARP